MSWFSHAAASVRVRVTAVATLFVLLVTAAGAVVIVLVIGQSVGQSLIDSAGQDAAAIDAQLAQGVSPTSAAISGRGDVVVQLLDSSGSVVATDRPDRRLGPLRSTVGVTGTKAIPGLADKYTVVARAVTAPDSEVRLVVVARSTEQRDDVRGDAARAFALAVPALAAVLALIVWVSVGRALRPMEVMRAEAGTITAAHLRKRLAVPPGDDEIPRLAVTLNEMLDRIDESQRLQRQFVSDASHELRTPISVLRQTAEVAHSYPDRVELGEFAEDVLAESARLESLVGSLLLLARVEARSWSESAEVDVDDVVLAEVARVRANRPDGPAIDISRVGAGRVLGEAMLLGRVVGNLLSNAQRHAVSTIRVSLTEDEDWVTLRVEDDGSGIPAEDRERVFERFVRLDESRARDAGGSGLGLAIVRSLVETFGGTIVVSESPLGGALVEVRLPHPKDT